MSKPTQTYGSDRAKYFVVGTGPEAKAPTRPHNSRFKAETEAKRLCAETPGRTFHVVKLKSTFVLTKGDVQDAKLRDLRADFKVGQAVRIGSFHPTYANEPGTIAELPVEDTSVKVELETGGLFRFSPTSLVPAEQDIGG
jgi:hypothetical protein